MIMKLMIVWMVLRLHHHHLLLQMNLLAIFVIYRDNIALFTLLLLSLILLLHLLFIHSIFHL